jgi:predicted glycosyltransferase
MTEQEVMPELVAAAGPKPSKVRQYRPFLILLYAQDQRGLGHINRTLTIARHLLAANPRAVAYIATRSPINNGFVLPERCDYIKLATRIIPDCFPRDVEDKRHFRRARRHMLRDAAECLSPDLVIVDHEPLGANGEFREGLYALKEMRPDATVIYGLRDIMDDPDRIKTQWEQMGAYGAFRSLFDGIVVYGSQRLFDVADAYGIPEDVRPKLHYCGYMVRERPTVDPADVRRRYGLPPDGPLIVATIGGGCDGHPVLDAAQEAIARLQKTRPNLAGILVTGPFMPAERKAALHAKASPRCPVVESADIFQLIAAGDAVVGMAGFNTTCEALSLGRPLVMVPRSTDKVEQEIRARVLAGRDLARWIHPKDLTPDRLVKELTWGLDCDRSALLGRVQEVIPSFDGAARLTQYLGRWMNDA